MKLKDLNWVRGVCIGLTVWLVGVGVFVYSQPALACSWAWIKVAGMWWRVCI